MGDCGDDSLSEKILNRALFSLLVSTLVRQRISPSGWKKGIYDDWEKLYFAYRAELKNLQKVILGNGSQEEVRRAQKFCVVLSLEARNYQNSLG